MQTQNDQGGYRRKSGELRTAMAKYRRAFGMIVLLSALLNILLLGGALYMMLVYDSVLPSHSLPTLAGLFGLLLLVYLFQAMFDQLRTRILGDVAAGFGNALSRRVQRAMVDAHRAGVATSGDGLTPMRDLDDLRRFLSGQGPISLIDMPWAIFFCAVLLMLHIWLGVTALLGGVALVILTLITDRLTRTPMADMAMMAGRRNGLAEDTLNHAEMLDAMGMRERMLGRWEATDGQYAAVQGRAARVASSLGGFSRIGRMLLQSAILTVGALLVVRGEASGGVIFASSLLAARALAPVDQAISNWRGLTCALMGWRRLEHLLSVFPQQAEPATLLPAPVASLRADNLVIAPPGTRHVTVQGVGFELVAGDALAIIGPSAAGKSSLGRALIGLWPVVQGSVRLDGATLEQWPRAVLGRHIGYLPQTIELLEGTVAQNIARFDPSASSETVIKAARIADVHEMIVALPDGYETMLGREGLPLSIGQQQRLALARALYDDPFLVLLDEPNSNLDPEGEAALQSAIASVRHRGGIVLVIAHRASALAHVNKALLMRNGRMQDFGMRDAILARLMPARGERSSSREAPIETRKVG